MRHIIIIVIIIFLFSTMPFFIFYFSEFQNKIPFLAKNSEIELKIKTNLPFNITKNEDFEIYKTSGNGSIISPYIIENFIVNVSGFGVDGILIKNTNAHFILRNCTVTNAGSGYSGYSELSGIKLENVTNGKIMNNKFSNNKGLHTGSNGIRLYQSKNNIISNNIANFNDLGIFLEYLSMNNIIFNNTANNSRFNGIKLASSCKNNSLISNIIYNNNKGISLMYSCDNNTISENTIKCNVVGLDFNQVSNNTSINNEVNNNTAYGIQLKSLPLYSEYNVFINNTVNFNTMYGIFLGGLSNNNKFINNCVNQNNDGFFFDGAYLATLINNTVNYNTRYGIRLSSENNSVSYNVVNYNFYGISLNSAINNDIKNNVACNNFYGIFLQSAFRNQIINNTINNNGNALYLRESDYNNVSLNTINKNENYGICLNSSCFNIITRNILYNNLHCVYETPDCSGNNTIENNDCGGNIDTPDDYYFWIFVIVIFCAIAVSTIGIFFYRTRVKKSNSSRSNEKLPWMSKALDYSHEFEQKLLNLYQKPLKLPEIEDTELIEFFNKPFTVLSTQMMAQIDQLPLLENGKIELLNALLLLPPEDRERVMSILPENQRGEEG